MTDHHTWTTPSAKPAEVVHDWYVVDASGLTVGRLATRISQVLQGKHKAIYTPHVDTGDFVIIVNAEKVVFTGRKIDQKKYYRYSGYPGGLRTTTARVMLDTHPDRVNACWDCPCVGLGGCRAGEEPHIPRAEHPR